ncbi:unnamed protein product, partial [Effrenium voratum]
ARQPLLALRRTQRICDAVAELRADLVCLQEHFFEPEHQKLYQHFADAEGYSYLYLQRSGWNSAGPSQDGVAILVKKATLEVEQRHDVHFQTYDIPQDRVAMLLRLRAKDGPLAVMCTHLTFPHHHYDERSREA